MNTKFSEVRKSVTALVSGIITWAFTALADDSIDTMELVGLAAAVAGAFGVYQVPNVVRKVAVKRAAKKARG